MKIAITGTSGFIGKALFKNLNSKKHLNYIYTCDCTSEYSEEFQDIIKSADIIVHLGAISSTNADDKKDIVYNNVQKTIEIFTLAKKTSKIIYASSASVYGNPYSEYIKFDERDSLNPQSLYAKSKAYIDNIVMDYFPDRDIIGLRFFNVCSFTLEGHKSQPSPTYNFLNQLNTTGTIKLFHGSDEIYRDFIYIQDVINIIKFFMNYKNSSAKIVNVGSGTPVSFEAIATTLINRLGFGNIKYIDRPKNLSSSYQTYTRADLTFLRSLGYQNEIPSIIHYIKNMNIRYRVDTDQL